MSSVDTSTEVGSGRGKGAYQELKDNDGVASTIAILSLINFLAFMDKLRLSFVRGSERQWRALPFLRA